MSRELWLLRHADAEPHGSRPDPERRLTARGESQARVVGRAIEGMGVLFEAVLSSPKERARRTTELAVAEWGAPPGHRESFELHPPLAGGFDAAAALDAAAGLSRDGRLLLVGHEPDLSRIVAELTGARIDLKKSGLAVVRLGGGGGELITLLRPHELALIATGE